MLAVTATLSLLFTTGVAVARVSGEPHDRTVTEPVLGGADSLSVEAHSSGAPLTGSVTALYRHHSAAYWNWRYRTMRHLAYLRHNRIRQLKRTLMASPSVAEAINLASVVYGNGSWLWRVARCESTLQTDPPHNNPSRGLFQFRSSTFARTPFGSFSVYSPYASALAAGWMASRGRASEWVCE